MAWVQELSALDDICQIYKLWQLIIKSTFQRGTENDMYQGLAYSLRIHQESLSGET